MNYNLRDARTKTRALYVSSGNDLKLASNMVDDQLATSFGFSVEDKFPAAVFDLGKVCTVRHLSAIYSARPGSIDFYVMQSLPGGRSDNSAGTVKFNSNALASLKHVGSMVDDGTQGRASIDFPATSGRYVMLRWTPAAHADTSFTVAAFAATDSTDSKDMPDSKDVSDSKDIPEEGPAEVPPLGFPDSAPPFTFIPQLVPVSL